jgi:hypothetical protein
MRLSGIEFSLLSFLCTFKMAKIVKPGDKGWGEDLIPSNNSKNMAFALATDSSKFPQFCTSEELA